MGVTSEGLEGDQIGNPTYHGGADQALYLYSQQDYDWWSQRLGRALQPGSFGENLTVSHWGQQPLRVGDVWQIGPVRLQFTAPRIPCAKLSARLGDPKFLKAFVKANRAGGYARVLQGGTLAGGEPVVIEPWEGQAPTLAELFRFWHSSKDRDPQWIRMALGSPLAERARKVLLGWLEE